jgi:transposase
MEILTGVERRRRWSEADKLRILREAASPGCSVADVARRHDLSRSQIYQWRRAFQLGRFGADGMAMVNFLPVEVCDVPQGGDDSGDAISETPAVDPLAVSVAISLRGGRTLHVPSSLGSCEITRLIVAVEAAS